MRINIDINCDMGESFGDTIIGNDEALFPLISSCNIACGFHGGDPFHIKRTIEMAIRYGLRIGAHPSYPDREGFGRRYIKMEKKELAASIEYQVAALQGMTASAGGKLQYVKPHGALYNQMAHDMEEAKVVIMAIKNINPELSLMGLANSPLENLAKEEGIDFIREAFADRQYEDNGQLTPRTESGAVIHDGEIAAQQVISILTEQRVITRTKNAIAMEADSFCIHGDNPKAELILKVIHKKLEELNIKTNLS